MVKWRYILLLTTVLMLLAACISNDDSVEEAKAKESEKPVELFVSAAASLTDAMAEIKEVYEAENNVELTFNFAGSGKLAQQIQQGAPVDIFISANENWMDKLEADELIVSDTRVKVTGNKLVLIENADAHSGYTSFEDIDVAELDEIAIGNPESVPAGEYAKGVLTSLKKWDEIEPKVIITQDVRQVLTYVETGNAEIGFVYESDALSADKVAVLAESDPSMHDAIIYPGAITKDSQYITEGEAFLEFMLSNQGQHILKKYGFTI